MYFGFIMNRLFRFRIATILIVFAVVSIGLAYYIADDQDKAKCLTSRGGRRRSYRSGKEVEIITAGNALDRTVVCLILHYSAENPDRMVLKPELTYSSNDPIPDLQSSCRLTTCWPPSSKTSGLWIDGNRYSIGKELTCVYISDKIKARRIKLKGFSMILE